MPNPAPPSFHLYGKKQRFIQSSRSIHFCRNTSSRCPSIVAFMHLFSRQFQFRFPNLSLSHTHTCTVCAAAAATGFPLDLSPSPSACSMDSNHGFNALLKSVSLPPPTAVTAALPGCQRVNGLQDEEIELFLYFLPGIIITYSHMRENGGRPSFEVFFKKGNFAPGFLLLCQCVWQKSGKTYIRKS